MDLIECPRCGEMFSTSYKKCPFCEEEDRPRKLRYDNRNGRHVSEKKKTHSARGAMIAVLALALVLLTWYQFGDEIMDRAAPKEEHPAEQTVEPQPAAQESEVPEGQETGTAPVVEEVLPEAVDVSSAALSSTDFTAKVGESVQLSVTGIVGDAAITWSSENSTVAAVNESGLVKAVNAGTTSVKASVGDRELKCIVRVSGDTSAQEATNVDVSGAKMSSTDFTAYVGESVQLKVSGTSASVSWSSGDSAVATVSSSGLVKAISAGQTKVYAKVGDRTLSCIVRIK